MTDIVERLRSPDAVLDGELPFEAADEIERLTGIISDLLWAIGHDYNEAQMNATTAHARRALEPKP